MSEALTGTAPTDDTAAPSVEDPAPEAPGEVGTGSAEAPKGFVPEARFNGLMGAFNKAKNDYERQLEELRSEVESLRQPTRSEENKSVSDPAVESLQSQVQQLTEMLMQERLENARRTALEEFPEAKPFADLIIANDADGIREMARILAERVKEAGFTASGENQEPAPPAGEQSEATAPTAQTPPAAPEAPVTPGGQTFSAEAPLQDRVAEAIKKKDFASYLRAKAELAEAGTVEG